MGEHPLARAERHVTAGRRIVQRQRELIAREHAHGRPTWEAEALLSQFESSLSGFEEDLARLLEAHERG